jgi:hypothetical protein
MKTKHTVMRLPEADKQQALKKAKSVPTTLTMLTLLGWQEIEKKDNKLILESLKNYRFDSLGRRNVKTKLGRE